jgi:hypothetical protein
LLYGGGGGDAMGIQGLFDFLLDLRIRNVVENAIATMIVVAIIRLVYKKISKK